MKIYVLSADVDFPPSMIEGKGRTISVFLKRGENLIHNFRCIECGKIVFQYTGDVSYIFDGAVIPKEKATINVLCHRCKILYRTL